MNITAYTPNYISSQFAAYPDDIFLQTVLDDTQDESPPEARSKSHLKHFITLYRLSQVCQDLKFKVDNCWFYFLHNIGKTPADFPDIDFSKENSEFLELLQKQIIFDLKILNPKITEKKYNGYVGECVNYDGSSFLCALERADLWDQKFTLLLPKSFEVATAIPR